MKKILLMLLVNLACISITFAQSPNLFNYQAVIRDNAGELIVNTDIGIRVSILEASTSGYILYKETQSDVTSKYGLVNLISGASTATSGPLRSIDESQDRQNLRREIVGSGASAYI